MRITGFGGAAAAFLGGGALRRRPTPIAAAAATSPSSRRPTPRPAVGIAGIGSIGGQLVQGGALRAGDGGASGDAFAAIASPPPRG